MPKASQGSTCVCGPCLYGLLMDFLVHNADSPAKKCLPVNTTEGKCSLNFVQVAPLSCDLCSCAETDCFGTHMFTRWGEYGSHFPVFLSVFSQNFIPSLFCCLWDWLDLLDQARLGIGPVGTDQYKRSLSVEGTGRILTRTSEGRFECIQNAALSHACTRGGRLKKAREWQHEGEQRKSDWIQGLVFQALFCVYLCARGYPEQPACVTIIR